MMSIYPIKASPARAAKYYEVGDYYKKEGDAASQWIGAGAARLNLDGAVNTDRLTAVLSGDLPGNAATSWSDGDRHMPGWDFTLSAPKSVSVMALVAGDRDIIEAHNAAAAKAMAFLERYATVRERGADGTVDHKLVGNLTIARFTETTSRENDPQLHTHNVVANVAYDKDREGWYALHSKPLFDMKMAAGQYHRAALAEQLKGLGYTLETDPSTGTFEIAGVDPAVLRLFSKRAEQIKDKATENGAESAQDKARIAQTSRSAVTKTNASQLSSSWREEARDYVPALDRLRHERQPSDLTIDQADTDRAVKQGIYHLANREAAVDHGHVLQQSLRFGIGRTTPEAVESKLDRLEQAGLYLKTTEQTGGRRLHHGRTFDAAVTQEEKIKLHVIRAQEKVRPLAQHHYPDPFDMTTAKKPEGKSRRSAKARSKYDGNSGNR